MWSYTRPGVPTITSAPACSAWVCTPIGAPPYTAITEMFLCRASASNSCETCRASSRVLQSTSALALRVPPGIRSRMGMPNAAVFPVPVLLRQMTSRPAKMGPNTAACTGVGVVYPRSPIPRRSSSDRGSSAKLVLLT